MSDFASLKVAAEAEPEKVEKGPAEDGEEDDGDNTPAPEEESTATFAPVVRLEKVEVKTLEEDEDVLYKQRAKLFIYGETLLDKGTGTKTWKERGVGDVKILKHRENNRIRVLMRQDKTMKIIINHFIDPRIKMEPNATSEKSMVWIAYDFADGESLVETTFCIKMGSTENVLAFKKAFEGAQADNKVLMEGLDSAEGAKEADDASAALASLDLKPAGGASAETEVVATEGQS